MINAYLIDSRGVYQTTVSVDPMGPQPAGAIYQPLPAPQVGHTRIWNGSAWTQVPDVSVPPVPEPPPMVPQVVSRAQGKAVLIQMGLWTGVVSFVEAITDPTERALAEVALYDTIEWRRDSEFLATAAGALSLSPEQLDAMFIAADQIVF